MSHRDVHLAGQCDRRTSGRRGPCRCLLDRSLKLELLEERRLLAITVDTLLDEADGSLFDGDISLRDAIALAPAGETITFAPILASGGPATIQLSLGELAIDRKLSLVGPGATLLTLNVLGGGSRHFNIDDGTDARRNVAISGLTLTGGSTLGDGGAILTAENLTIDDCTITGNSSGGATPNGRGGALHAAANTSVAVRNSSIRLNRVGESGFGGGVSSLGSLTIAGSIISDNAGGFGGGVFSTGGVTDDAANVEIVDSTISGNAAASGGGILSIRGGVQVTDSTVGGNSAAYGGGVYGYESTLLLTRSTITGNTALGIEGTGGGVLAIGVLLLIDSTVSGNSAAYGGGVYGGAARATVTGSTICGNTAAVHGGGIYLLQADLTMSGATISGNSAGERGGGVWIKDNTASITSSTIAGNAAGLAGGGLVAVDASPVLNHSIVARNTRGAASIPSDATGAVTLSYSLLGTIAGASITDSGNNLFGSDGAPLDPHLGPLADNGGPTMTHALLAGSPAIDAGNLAALMGMGGIGEFDQRGGHFLRIVNSDGVDGARLDIGAFEHNSSAAPTLIVDTLVDEADGSVADGDVSLRDAIAAAAPGATIVFADALTSGGPATITLTLGQLAISHSLTIFGPGAELLTIDASGNDPTPATNSADGSRVFLIQDGNANIHKEVAISGLTLTGGDASGVGGAIWSDENLTLSGCTLQGNYASEAGGGISCSGSVILGATSIANCTIRDNESGNVGGGINAHGLVTVTDSTISNNRGTIGGGIFHAGVSDRRLTIVNSTISGNTANAGGGITTGYVTIIGGEVRDNTAYGDGGGISQGPGDLVITGCAITGNAAGAFGGAVRRTGTGFLVVNDSEISGNSAGELGGGILSSQILDVIVADSLVVDNEGGGLATRVGPLTVVGSTVSGHAGFGIYTEFSPVTVVECTINGNAGKGGIFINSGALTLTDSVVSGNSNLYDGGGVYVRGSATITGCTISGNSSNQYGGGIGQYGGGVTVDNCTISGNTALGAGGGLYSGADAPVRTTLTVLNSTIRGNSSGDGADGGGLRTMNCTAVIMNSKLAENVSGFDGGAISHNGGNLTVIESALQGNSAARNGGGMWVGAGGDLSVASCTINNNSAHGNGGGVDSSSDNFTLSNSTVSGNSAAIGGGLFVNARATVRHSTVALNNVTGVGKGIFVNSGQLTLDHAIVSQNSGNNGDINGLLGTTTSARRSLVGNNQGSGLSAAAVGVPDANGNLIGTSIAPIDPRLGPLAANGGPTLTHALLAGSPAMDAGDPAAKAGVAGVPLTDQRGAAFGRVFGGQIDVGAVERQPLPADFSNDGAVNGLDFLAWQRGVGQTNPPPTKANGDADGDHDADGHDLAAWRSSFGVQDGAVAASGASALTVTVDERPVVLNAALVDAAMAYEQLLVDAAPRRSARPGLLRAR